MFRRQPRWTGIVLPIATAAMLSLAAPRVAFSQAESGQITGIFNDSSCSDI